MAITYHMHYLFVLYRRKWYEGCEDPINEREYSQEQGICRSPSYTAHLSSSSLFLSAKSDVSSQSSGATAEGSVIELEQQNSEKTNSGGHNLVNYLGLDMSDVDTHYPVELGQHEIFNPGESRIICLCDM